MLLIVIVVSRVFYTLRPRRSLRYHRLSLSLFISTLTTPQLATASVCRQSVETPAAAAAAVNCSIHRATRPTHSSMTSPTFKPSTASLLGLRNMVKTTGVDPS